MTLSKLTSAQKTTIMVVLRTHLMAFDLTNIELTASGSVIITTPTGQVGISKAGTSTVIGV